MLLLYLGAESVVDHVRANLPASYEISIATDDEGVMKIIGGCDVILDAYMKIRFTAERIDAAKNLKLFVTATTGADHIDEAALEKRGIPLLTLKGQRDILRNITPAAEHTWLLLMACARRLPDAMKEVYTGRWDRNKYPGIMLRGKTIGIIGCGRIGQWIAKYATAFGMICIGYDPYLADWPENIQQTSLHDLLARSDFITVNVTLTDETSGMLGVEEFSKMKPGVIMVNTSRGDVIDERALLASLKNGHVAAAGLDVLTGEPEVKDHPLVIYAKKHGNLIITPHIAGFSPDALKEVLAFSCGRIVDYFKD